jgi:hypothetical protein
MSYLCAVFPSESCWTLTVVISRGRFTFLEAGATIFARIILEIKFNYKHLRFILEINFNYTYLKTKSSGKYVTFREMK